jgi:hypothetical protein
MLPLQFGDIMLPLLFIVDTEVQRVSAASVFRHVLPEDSVTYNQDGP